MIDQSSRPIVMTNVAEMVTVTRNSAALSSLSPRTLHCLQKSPSRLDRRLRGICPQTRTMCSFLSKAGGACCGRFIAAISAPAAACRRETRMTPSPGLAVGTPLPDTGGHAHVRLEKLDHLRFVACLMVMIWHFSHAFVPATVVPSWTWLSLIEEGHTGVSLFCVISGFIFGWLYYGRSIVLRQFARNRALRILPIFLLWLALAYVTSTW